MTHILVTNDDGVFSPGLLALKRAISALNPVIIHTHTSKAGILGRWAAWFYNRNNNQRRAIVIHTPHGHIFYGYFGLLKTFALKAAERLTARVTDYFIALTDGERRESIEQGLGHAAKWCVIPSGIRFNDRTYDHARRELAIAEDETVIAVVARLEPVRITPESRQSVLASFRPSSPS